MDNKNPYFRQLNYWFVFCLWWEASMFRSEGGDGNQFVLPENMPRLSVDIDLV
jgi:hypothetical protein